MDEQPVPFLGSVAVRAGRVTKNALRGPRFVRLLPDVYVPAGVPLDLATRSRAAYLLVDGVGALAGYSAAHLLGARCAPADADAEVLAPRLARRPARGVLLHRGRLSPDEVTEVDGRLVTSAVRTAYDLARRLPLVEAVAAVDALAHVAGVHPGEVRALSDRYPGARGRLRVDPVLDLVEPAAASVMETRTRLVLVLRGLPTPSLQHAVFDPDGRFVARLDLAYPAAKVGVEYDGAQHRDRGSFGADLRRHNRLVALGWVVLRFTADDVLHRPDASCAQVAAALARRAA